jgi:hypothetical protein
MQTAKVTALNGRVNGLHHKGSVRANAVAGRKSGKQTVPKSRMNGLHHKRSVRVTATASRKSGKQTVPRSRKNERAPVRSVKVIVMEQERNDGRILRTLTLERLLLSEAVGPTGMMSTGMTGRTSITIMRITIITGTTPLPHL